MPVTEAALNLMIGACDFKRLLLKRDILCSLARGVAALPPHTNKALAVRHCGVCQVRARHSALGHFPGRFQKHRLSAMSSMPQSAPPAAAENGLHEDELEAITRQIHELQVYWRTLSR